MASREYAHKSHLDYSSAVGFIPNNIRAYADANDSEDAAGAHALCPSTKASFAYQFNINATARSLHTEGDFLLTLIELFCLGHYQNNEYDSLYNGPSYAGNHAENIGLILNRGKIIYFWILQHNEQQYPRFKSLLTDALIKRP